MRQCDSIRIHVEMKNGDCSHFDVRGENHEDLIGEVCRVVRFSLGMSEPLVFKSEHKTSDGVPVWVSNVPDNQEEIDEPVKDNDADGGAILENAAESEVQAVAGAEVATKKQTTGRKKKAEPEQIVAMKDVVALVSEAAEKHSKEEVKEVLADYNGAKKLADLSEADLCRFYADMPAMVKQ